MHGLVLRIAAISEKKNSKLYLHAAFAGLISFASLTGVDITLAEKNKY